MELPKLKNEISYAYIDATPEGYALRILRHYRERCNEIWEVHGLSKNESRIYEMMNGLQAKRAKELDKAIRILEEGG